MPHTTLPADELRLQQGATAQLSAEIASLWAQHFKRPGVDPQEDFFSLGGDSLGAMTMTMKVEDAVGAEVPLSILFETPVLKDYVARVGELLAANSAQRSPN